MHRISQATQSPFLSDQQKPGYLAYIPSGDLEWAEPKCVVSLNECIDDFRQASSGCLTRSFLLRLTTQQARVSDALPRPVAIRYKGKPLTDEPARINGDGFVV